MRVLTLSAAFVVLALVSTSGVSAKEATKFNTASCNYAPADIKVDQDGREKYNIVCIRQTIEGYQRFSFGIGKNQSVKMTASGKNQLVYNEKTRTLKDGNKTIFTYKGTNIRSAVTPITTKSVVFQAKSPSLTDFATYFNNHATCAR
jgi:hypothetical protein